MGTITLTNAAPGAANSSASATTGDPRTITLPFSPTDADGDLVTLVSVTAGAHLTVNSTSGAQVTFTPATDFVGASALGYAVRDGFGGTAIATVAVTITDNDAPVIALLGSNPMSVQGGSSYVDAGVTATDVVSGSLGVTTSGAVNTAVPGAYSLTYSATDAAGNTATATRTVNVVNTNPPVANNKTLHAPAVGVPTVIYSAAEDTNDADGDARTLSLTVLPLYGSASTDGATVSYTNNGFTGSDTITLQVSDGFGGTDTGTITLTNVAPVAGDDAGIYAGSPVTIDVLANDTDGDLDTLMVTSAGPGGTGTVATDGATVTYTPGAGFAGTDAFAYTVSDGHGGTATGTVQIANSAPTESTVAGSGDSVPGEELGTTFKTFGVPAINDGGQVAFLTTLTTPTGNVESVFDGTAVVAHKGDLVPNAAGAPIAGLTFANFKDPGLNGAGRVAFFATIAGAGVVAKDKNALFANAGGTLRLVVREGRAAPDVAGMTLEAISAFVLTDDAIFFTGKLLGATTATDKALWAWTPEAGAHLLLRDGAALGGKTVKLFVALDSAPGSDGHGRSTAADEVLARVSYTDGTQGIVAVNTAGLATTVAATGDATGTAGVTLKDFGQPIINGAHGFGVLAGLTGAPSASNSAVFADNGSGLSQIFSKGDFAPGLAPLKLGTFDDPVFNTNGDVAAVVTLTGVGLTTANKKAIVLKPASGAAAVVARLGDQPADVAVGAKWKAFTSVALPDGLGPVFLATMVQGVGGVVTNNDRGMWARNSAGVLQLLAREGDVIDGKTLKTITVFDSVSGSSDQTRAFNANQKVVYHAAFTDGTSGIVRVDVP